VISARAKGPWAWLFDTPSRSVIAVAAALAAVIVAGFGYSVYDGYRDALALAERDTRNATAVLAEHAARTADSIEESLRAVSRLHTDVAAGRFQDPDTVHAVLQAIHGGSPVIRSVGWIDADGVRRASSLSANPPPLAVADQEHFLVHRDNPHLGLHISAPIESRLTGDWIINATIRLNDSQGRFVGVAGAVIAPGYFSDLYRTIDLGPDRMVLLLRGDGTILSREPHALLGQTLADRPGFQQIQRLASGTVHVASVSLDGAERIASFAKVIGRPLHVVVSMSRTDALEAFYGRMLGELPRLALLLGVLALSAGLLASQLRRREENERARRLLASVVESTDDAIFTRTLDGTITSWNDGAAKMFGYGAAEAIGQPVSIIVPDDRKNEPAVLSGSVAMGSRVTNMVTRRRRKNGGLVDVSITASPLRDAIGAVVGVAIIAREITDRMRTQQALQQAQSRLQAITDNISGVVYRRILHPDGRITLPYISESVRALHGHAPDDSVAPADRLRAAVLPEDRPALEQSVHDSARQCAPWSHEWRFLHADGSVRWLRGTANAPQILETGEAVWDVVAIDITDLKQAEAGLKHSEERYRALYGRTPVMMHSIDAEGRLVAVSDTWLESLGYTRDEVIGRRSSEFLTPDSQQHARTVVLPAFFRTGTCKDVPYQFVKKSGGLIDVLLSAVAERDAEGRVMRSLAVLIDVTEQKRAEAELRDSEERFRSITANVPGIVYRRVRDAHGRLSYTYFNKGVADIFGVTPERAVADAALITDAVHPDDRQAVLRSIDESARNLSEWQSDFRIIARDGTVKWLSGRSRPRQDSAGQVVWDGVIVDITESRQAQDALHASETRAARAYGLLEDAIESLNDGFVLYDANDRLVMMNRIARNWDPGFAAKAVPGSTYEEVLRLAVNTGRINTEGRDPETFIRQRLTLHRKAYGRPVERQIAGRWYQVREHPTSDGGVVVVRTDVTEIKRREAELSGARAEAERAHARLVDGIESLSDGFLLWDADDRLVLRNEAVSRTDTDKGEMLVPGVRFAEVMAQRVKQGRIPQARGREEAYIRERLALHQNPSGETIEQEFEDGRWVSLRERRTRDGGIVSVRTDITELKRREAELMAARAEADQARARLVDAIESLEDGFVLWDKDDRLVLWNQAIMRLAPEPEVEPGITFAELMRKRIAGGRIQAAIGREAEYLAERIAWHSNPDGKPVDVQLDNGRWTRLRGRRTRDGGMVSIRSDITESKQRESELMAARAAADAASQAKSEFLSRMSHELRTQLNAIIGFAQMLQLDRKNSLSSEQREYANFILNGGQHLLSLVNEVLDFARIEAGTLKLTTERVSVMTSLADIKHTMTPMAAKADIPLVVMESEDMPDVRADELRLRQILINLTSNAIKYNRPGGTVRLSASHHQGRVRFEIADSGPGISSEHHADLFQPFQRLGAEYTTVEGTGIGLAICKRLTEAMGGSIGFTTAMGLGSTFWVDLPVETAPAAAARPSAEVELAAAAPLATAGGFTLLYVEDNPANLRLMEHLISTLPNVEMLSAPTPKLGLELAAAHRPDVIVLDLNLPGMSGYELLARLKAMPETRDSPVMALTAAALPRDIERGLAAGFFRYLTKPLDIKAFLAAVDEVLATRDTRQRGAAD
jgi:PAS domain S-box-containing protein